MAAIDLRRGLEHGGRGWGQERTDLADGFDSEMQEWEDQLQDMQKKIEELYNEVQARRGGSDIAEDKPKNGDALQFGLGHRGAKGRQVAVATASKHRGGNGNGSNGGFDCGPAVASEIGDLLQDYLGRGADLKRRNNGARHVHFKDTTGVSHDLPKHRDEAKSRSVIHERSQQQPPSGSVEETENQKNRTSQTRGSPNKENTGAKPPLRQRDPSPSAPPRSTSQLHPGTHADSPALDRKSFGTGLADRKCGSPSVLRKFGAMLHENEGKTLTDGGVVSCPDTSPETPTPKGSTPSELGQERACHGYPAQRRGAQGAQVAGSPKPRPRADSGSESGRRGCAPSRYGQRSQRGQGEGTSGGRGKEDGLIELLDMLDIQHEYGAAPRGGNTPYRQDPPQINPAESSAATHTNSFSRPTRPANQRPPSRWASRTPTARITAPSGPMNRPASPLPHAQSPALKHKSPICYSRHTETAII
ncbi:hypothetical protein NHX12_025909 [Muraenolepis orangiensis]|uniref:SOGA 1/2-like coiled-coil domain-containing protein n=1 Tax=Muraenolepis orangiensis TaxID=630683 RepID=A0A9Q0IQ92_9TELE|nr:hypothetical protein NHX12_025909 [Muraenolepis orangiensis]